MYWRQEEAVKELKKAIEGCGRRHNFEAEEELRKMRNVYPDLCYWSIQDGEKIEYPITYYIKKVIYEVHLKPFFQFSLFTNFFHGKNPRANHFANLEAVLAPNDLLNLPNHQGKTALHMLLEATGRGSSFLILGIVSFVVNRFQNFIPDIQIQSKNGKNALHYYCRKGFHETHTQKVLLLLMERNSRKAVRNAIRAKESIQGFTPLHMFLADDANGNMFDVVKRLKAVPVGSERNSILQILMDDSVLLTKCNRGKLPVQYALDLLSSSGEDLLRLFIPPHLLIDILLSKDNEGDTLLHTAACRVNENCTHFLSMLKHYVDSQNAFLWKHLISQLNHLSKTPLHLSLSHKKSVLEKGKEALNYLFSTADIRSKQMQPHNANLSAVRLLCDEQVLLTRDYKGRNPLHYFMLHCWGIKQAKTSSSPLDNTLSTDITTTIATFRQTTATSLFEHSTFLERKSEPILLGEGRASSPTLQISDESLNQTIQTILEEIFSCVSKEVKTECLECRDHYGWTLLHIAFASCHQESAPDWFQLIITPERINSRESIHGNPPLFLCKSFPLLIDIIDKFPENVKLSRVNNEGKNLKQFCEDCCKKTEAHWRKRGFTVDNLSKLDSRMKNSLESSVFLSRTRSTTGDNSLNSTVENENPRKIQSQLTSLKLNEN